MTVTDRDEPERAAATTEQEPRRSASKPSPVPRARAEPDTDPRPEVDDTAEIDDPAEVDDTGEIDDSVGEEPAESRSAGETRSGTVGGPTRAKPRRSRRSATTLACLAAVVVVLTSAAVWFAFEVHRLRGDSPEENAAIVDSERTAQVREQVSAAVESLFSYNYASLKRTRRAAEQVLLQQAREEYTAKLSAATDEVKQRKLVRTTSVRAIGVRELHEQKARVLLFLDQQTLAGDDKRSSSTMYLEVVAKKVGGSWKIAKMSGG